MTDENNQKKDSLDVAETYCINFQINEPRHFDMRPKIIDWLTYIDEYIDEKTKETIYERKRLSPYEKELYMILKQSAGEGACWKGRDTLAKEMNCAPSQITKFKRILQMPFEQLDGKSLIIIEERRLATYRDEKKINTRPNHLITVNHIWDYNNAFMSIFKDMDYDNKYKLGVLTKKEAELEIEKFKQPSIVDNLGARSYSDRADGARSYSDRAPQRALSYSDIINTPSNHTPYDKSYLPPGGGQRDDVSNNDIYDMMSKYGIFRKLQKKLTKDWSIEHIRRKIKEFEVLKNSKDIENHGSYLAKMINSY